MELHIDYSLNNNFPLKISSLPSPMKIYSFFLILDIRQKKVNMLSLFYTFSFLSFHFCFIHLVGLYNWLLILFFHFSVRMEIILCAWHTCILNYSRKFSIQPTLKKLCQLLYVVYWQVYVCSIASYEQLFYKSQELFYPFYICYLIE